MVPLCLQSLEDDKYRLREVITVFGGQEVGYLREFNGAETEAMYDSINGIVAKHITVHKEVTNNNIRPGEDPDKKRSLKDYGDPLLKVESKRKVGCKAPGCNCGGVVYRINYGKPGSVTTGLLYYEEIDPTTKRPYEHENHSIPSSKIHCSLTTQQRRFIIRWAQRKSTTKIEQRAMVAAMIKLDDIRTTPEQEDDSETFVAKVGEFIRNNPKYFKHHKINDSLSSNELYQILNHLKSDKDSAERNRKFKLEGIGRYFLSSDGTQVNNCIKVLDHDHNGTTWSFIQFEYLHASELARLAVQMYPNKKMQLEIDYFVSVCKGNEWVVGHLGLSDRGHKYYPMTMIICKSENHTSAGRLLTRATDLLKEHGGDARSVLVDGGKALAKAIGKENELRQAQDTTASEEMTNTEEHMIGTAEGEEIDQVCDEIMVTLIEGSTDEETLEARLSRVLNSHKLKKERCVAHITRKAGSRGGGWRGGKGSLCRALLNGGCSKQKMQKVSFAYYCSMNERCCDCDSFAFFFYYVCA